MTREEFEKITRVKIGDREWEALEEMYMRADVDWTTFVHAWKRMVPVRWAQGRNGRRRYTVEGRPVFLGKDITEAWERRYRLQTF